jgi:hypothetical protein
MKDYPVTCPGCEEEFDAGVDPALLADDGAVCVECPGCFEESDWMLDTATGALVLVDNDLGDEEDDIDTDEPPE